MDTTLVRKAVALATELHAGQTDKAGAPYLGHVTRVMEGVREKGELAMAAAVLHDSVEDTDMTPEKLLELGFPAVVVSTVQALTRASGESYEDFIVRVAAAGPLAVAVKMSDLRDNMRLDRLPHPSAEDLIRLERYRAAYAVLEKVGNTERELLCAEPVENIDVDAFAEKIGDMVVRAMNEDRKRQGKPPLEQG